MESTVGCDALYWVQNECTHIKTKHTAYVFSTSDWMHVSLVRKAAQRQVSFYSHSKPPSGANQLLLFS